MRMQIAIALFAVLIASTAVAADDVHLSCSGTQSWSGYTSPATVSLTVHEDFVEASAPIGGRIIQADDRRIVFMATSFVDSTNDNWKTSTRSDTCIWGSIDRIIGKAIVMITYGQCKPGNEPPQKPFTIASYYDLVCRVANRLF